MGKRTALYPALSRIRSRWNKKVGEGIWLSIFHRAALKLLQEPRPGAKHFDKALRRNRAVCCLTFGPETEKETSIVSSPASRAGDLWHLWVEVGSGGTAEGLGTEGGTQEQWAGATEGWL